MEKTNDVSRRDFLKTASASAAASALAMSSDSQGAETTPPALSGSELNDDELRRGAVLLRHDDWMAADPLPIVRKYEGLRVTDVLDALQAVGLQDLGLMDHSIRPLWRDQTERLAHRIYGTAVTYQYLPTNRPQAGQMPYDEFKKWHGHWYRTYAPELFSRVLRPGTVVVIDAHGIDNTGFIGSNNALNWKSRGMAGVITNGCCRDSDELILQRIPVYSKFQGGGTRPGRIEAGAINLPVSVGAVMVRPGDMIVADGDGVVVVPREQADKVAEIGWEIAGGDKKGRRRLYEQMQLPLDATVK